MRKPSLHCIVNPAAGGPGRRSIALNLVRRCEEGGCRVKMTLTEKKGDAERAARLADADRLLCFGGDGTLSETVNGLMRREERLPLGYIPTGTTNDFARSFGFQGSPRLALKRAVLGPPRSVDVGRFQDRYFCYLAALGAFTDISYTTPARLKKRFGRAAYFYQAFSQLSQLKPEPMRIELDGSVLEGDFLFAAVLNANSVGGMELVSPDAVCCRDGRFEVLLVRSVPSVACFSAMLYNLLTHRYGGDDVLLYHASRIVFTSENPLRWCLDGENGGVFRETVIQNEPRALPLVLPSESCPSAGMPCAYRRGSFRAP